MLEKLQERRINVMNILYSTQASSLPMFFALNGALTKGLDIDQTGFTLSDSSTYLKWLENESDFESKGYHLLKEWEITEQRSRKVTLEQLTDMEERIGCDAGLFGAIVADRRLFMGEHCTYTQDYNRRFSDAELYSLLATAVESIENLFDRLNPDLVVSFICVTMLDYLTYLVAKSRDIKVLNLRPTRVSDRVSFSMFLNDPSPELEVAYSRLCDGAESKFHETATDYIKRVREEHGRYEGVVQTSDKPALKSSVTRYLSLIALKKGWTSYRQYRKSFVSRDNHVPNPLYYIFYSTFLNPLRAKYSKQKIQQEYVQKAELKEIKYAFFPLHTEPEVSLLVYGRPYVNQIEVIRMIAMSLPLDMVLLVKEHPWMVGKRSLKAYRKILNIPRVKLVSPKCEARTLIKDASLVTVITGSIALEAAMLDKPVITFGDCPYNLLPDNMVRRCSDPRHLQVLIKEMLNGYEVMEAELENYIAAVYETSVSVNLYSVLLGKQNVYTEMDGCYVEEVKKLAGHLLELIQGKPKVVFDGVDASKW